MVDATIDVIDRGKIRADINFFEEAATIASHSNPNPENEMIDIPVPQYVIDHPEATILWDTGSHEDALESHWPDWMIDVFRPYNANEHTLQGDLEKEEWSLDDIDCVVISHLHNDHAGGLHHFDGTDVPIYVHKDEIQFAYYSEKTDEGLDSYILHDFDHDLNWKIIHQERENHFEDIEFIHLPGHTPGLIGALVELEDETVVLAGDQFYRAANYEEGVPLGAGLMWSNRHWFESLQKCKELERRHDAEVVYGHDLEQFEETIDGWGH